MRPLPTIAQQSKARDWIVPDWPAPAHVRALVTTRHGGTGARPYDTLNLSGSVEDAPETVTNNWALVIKVLGLPEQPRLLEQVHGNTVVCAGTLSATHDAQAPMRADGAVTGKAGRVCAVLTADCLPIFMCNRAGTRVGAIHAGWRGLAAGVIEAGVAAMENAGNDVLAWLGPAISAPRYQVGAEVRSAFTAVDPAAAEAFVPAGSGKWFADLYHLARQRLAFAGVGDVYGGGFCTFTDSERFFSHRRDGVTGRMAAMIWLES